MARYSLASHVYFCETPDGAVFLDLRKDRYFGLARPDLEALRLVADLGPVACNRIELSKFDGESEKGSEPDQIAQLLTQNGLLAWGSVPTRDVDPVGIEAAQVAIDPTDPIDRAETAAADLHSMLAFLRAAASAKWLLKTRGLEKMVLAVRAMKPKHQGVHAPDVARACAVARLFHRLRPYLFTGRDHCMFESLALLKFLHLCGVEAVWVFGVRTQPFGAHCWVQLDSVVLNACLEQVREFTPILTIRPE